jgi:3-hydroxypropionyl-CoA synthetase (ADP-forming)
MYQKYGFQVPRSRLSTTADEAARLASEVGFPVALKIVSPDVLHKTDVGGVALNLDNPDRVRQAFELVMTSVQRAHPQAHIEGIEVQEMVSGGAEVIIGLLDDPQFGPVIMFGLGGVFTQVLQDVSFRVLPIKRTDASQMIGELQSYPILQGYRGQPPVSEEMLVDLLMRANHMANELAGKFEAIDFNPIVVWGDQHRVLDAKLVWHPEASSAPSVTPPNTRHLENFFRAGSVALIGASATPGKIGNAVLDSLLGYDYQGKVFPINPGRDEIMGAKTYASLKDISEPVELVVVTVDLRLVPDIIEECAAQGIHNLVVISGGGKELGGERAELEASIRRLARQYDVRVVGPNCIGVFDGQTRLDTFFQVQERMLRPPAGPVAVLTQSGTIGAAFLEDAGVSGVSKFVSYGNRTDVDEADLLAYLADDPETGIIAMYVEGLEDGRKFLQVTRGVTPNKPVVVFKVGRTERAARASLSHTGFFGGSYSVAQGAFKQAGIIAVDSYEELVATTKALAMQPRAQGPRVAMISNGAGTMVQGIDLLKSYALEMPELSRESLHRLAEAYPPYYVVQNPIDVTGSATSRDYEVGMEICLQDPQVDIVMPWFVFQDTPLGEDIIEKLGRLTRTYAKPILVGAIGGGPFTMRMSRAIEAKGVPVFHSVREWMAAARGLAFNTDRRDTHRGDL